jgi:hypothetical protein
MLPTQILHKDSYDKNVHIKDVLIEFRNNNNQVSIDRFKVNVRGYLSRWLILRSWRLEINSLLWKRKMREN